MYQVIIASGLTPDAFMYGCLMRFSVQAGVNSKHNYEMPKQSWEDQLVYRLMGGAGKGSLEVAFLARPI